MVSAITPVDVERASERGAKHYELIRGELRHKPIGTRSMFVAGLIGGRLNKALYPQVGVAVTAAPIYCFGRPDHGRRPDVVYIRRERLEGAATPSGDLAISPDLVVEVLTPWMSALDFEDRLTDYLDAGVPLVWIVNPDRRTIRAYRADQTTCLYRWNDVVENDALLPGLRLVIADIFPPEQ